MNDISISSELYSEFIQGYEILYASVTDKNYMQVCLKEKVGPDGYGMRGIQDFGSRNVSYAPEIVKINGGYNLGWLTGVGYFYSLLHPNERKAVTLTDVFRVLEKETSFIDIGKPRDEWDEFTKVGQAIRIIGDHVYAAGEIFKLFKRSGVGEWEDLTQPEQHPNLFKHVKYVKKRDGRFLNANSGFDAFDGFDEQSIYAGGEQTLWRYDGQRWYELALPEYPVSINSVLCAGDGYVYITGRGGPIIRGRDDQWQVLDTPALDYKALAWFDSKVWVGSDYELGILEDGHYSRYKFPDNGPAQYSFMGVDACEDRLLSYGPDQVMLFDGKEWIEMIGPALV